jgi:hypothetical protein
MRCEQAELAISVAMDEPSAQPSGDVDEHVRGCARCRAFGRGAWRLRESARFEVAPPVPDLVPAIMARVRADAPVVRSFGPRPARPRQTGPARRLAVGALVAGLVVGFVLTSGGLIPRGSPSNQALATDIPHRLVGAAVSLDGYSATFDVTERHWTKAVPVRTFVAGIAFRAAEDFRVTVRDTTRYPSPAWPRNDLSLVTDGRTWRASGPDPCPAAALPACPSTGATLREVTGRPPFDAASPMPTDIIVPMTALAALDRVNMIGVDDVGGRGAQAVQVSYQDATPLFAYLRFAGSWRPFFPQDRVVVWLDSTTWFPLRYRVFPAPGAERALWAAQNGLPFEPPNRSVFEATIRSFSTAAAPASAFTVPASAAAVNEGFRSLPFPRTGPLLPTQTEGLRPVRFGSFAPSATRPYRESVAAYASGLAWLTVTSVTGWNQPHPFGIDPFPARVAIPGGGVGYYEPATATDPRRLALHTASGEAVIASNLGPSALARVAASLRAQGLPQPSSWRTEGGLGGEVERDITPQQAISRAGFALLPTWLPPGYRPVAAEWMTGSVHGGTVRPLGPPFESVTIVFRRPAAELDGLGLRLYQVLPGSLPPPTGAGEEQVLVGGVVGRWSPDEHTLEWIDAGVYRSLTGAAFDLTTMLRVASSLGSPAP